MTDGLLRALLARRSNSATGLQSLTGVKKKASVFLVLLFLGIGYFLLFGPPNAVGARDQNMISIFNADEFAQYPHVTRMMEPGKTLAQTLYRFFAYQHYYYGFPFYFFSSAAALFPLKLTTGLSYVNLNMLFLRQVVSILPMVFALMLLVALQTNFDSYVKSISLFILLLSVPEVVANNLWWHPESLVFLFIILTFFFLQKDDLAFGRYFYLAAIACGLAIATKLIGLFFFLTIPAYLLLGWRKGRINLRYACVAALGFVLTIGITFVLSNPFLYWASERAQALKIQTRQADAMSTGFVLAYGNSPWSWLNVITELYGLPAFLLLSLISLVIGILQGQKRILNLLILAWALPFTIYLFAAIVIRPKHFFLPILLPVFSSLPAFFAFAWPTSFAGSTIDWVKRNSWRLLLSTVGIGVIGWQFAYNLHYDTSLYQDALNREKDSSALQFYSALERDYLPKIVLDRQLIIYRDAQMYVADEPAYDVRFQWGTIDYDYVHKINADVLVLSKGRLHDFTQEGAQERALDPDFVRAYQFYKDALAGTVTGYDLLYQDENGIAYLSAPLYKSFFATK